MELRPEVTRGELQTALAIVSQLDPDEPWTDAARAIIYKLQAARLAGQTVSIRMQ